MKTPIFILLFFLASIPCFSKQSDSLKIDTLKITGIDLVLIKQDNHIINKDGKEKFYEIWMSDDWTKKNAIIGVMYKNQHFFDGCPSQEIIDLFGQPDGYGRYLAEKVHGQTEFCWITFIYREDQVWVTLFPCS
jgi:hypothetical protein